MVNIQGIEFPSREDFEKKPFDELFALYRRNMAVLLDYHMSVEVPFFGLHGTPEHNWRQILYDEGGHFNVGTFYTKERSKRRLFELLTLCKCTSSYVTKGESKTGGVMVFDLERDGSNISLPWQYLGTTPTYGLTSDPQDEREIIQQLEKDLESRLEYYGLEKDKNTLGMIWRSDISLNKERFHSIYAGTVWVSPVEYERYFAEITAPTPERVCRSVLRGRFRSQGVLKSTYELLHGR